MTRIEDVAKAALEGKSLLARSNAQDFLRTNPRLTDVPRPSVDDEDILATSAALVELFAERANQLPPPWAKEIGPVVQPVYLLQHAKRLKRLRTLCETESPLPLRKRRLYAPPNYLELV